MTASLKPSKLRRDTQEVDGEAENARKKRTPSSALRSHFELGHLEAQLNEAREHRVPRPPTRSRSAQRKTHHTVKVR